MKCPIALSKENGLKDYVNSILKALEMHQFLKVYFGMKMKLIYFSFIFINNEYKHKQNGFPRSIF
jgi:hypothetical protein